MQSVQSIGALREFDHHPRTRGDGYPRTWGDDLSALRTVPCALVLAPGKHGLCPQVQAFRVRPGHSRLIDSLEIRA